MDWMTGRRGGDSCRPLDENCQSRRISVQSKSVRTTGGISALGLQADISFVKLALIHKEAT
jgi:hypothetical protein